MARDKTPTPAAEPPPPTTGGAFERTPAGELKPIEESAARLVPDEAPPPAAESNLENAK